ncbi:MAG: hypothetical protein IJA12_08940 [Oscillospiraceae bacterium]|nr:hypothetical protein [Oscillospiraceae bacterium]
MEDMSAKIQEILSDKESMKQLSELAQMFSSSEETKESDCKNQSEQGSFMPDFDISMIMKLQDIMSRTQDDKTSGFLIALKPLLKEERRGRVDKAVKMLRLFSVWEILKESGLMNDFFRAGD